MSASTIAITGGIIHRVGINTTVVGSTVVPIEKTGANTVQGRIDVKSIVIAATGDSGGGDKVLVWDGTVAGAIRDWSVLSLQVTDSSGTLELYWQIDTPNSESDLAASGAHPFVIPDSMSCAAMKIYDNARVWANTDFTRTTGLTGGVPSQMTANPNDKLYKRYKLWVMNRGTSAVDLTFSVMD